MNCEAFRVRLSRNKCLCTFSQLSLHAGIKDLRQQKAKRFTHDQHVIMSNKKISR